MFRTLFSASLLFASAEAMAGRPTIGASAGKAVKVTKAKKVAKAAEMSPSVPFQERPAKLDGTMLGDIGFDPLGLSNLWDLNWLRAAELKHGRVGMLASLGFLVQEGYRLPGPASNPTLFSEAKTPLEALASAPPLGLAQIVAVIFLIELATSSKLLVTESFQEGDAKPVLSKASDTVPGDLGWDPLGLAADGVNGDYAIAELKHGRLAMIALLAMIVQINVCGKPVIAHTFEIFTP
mmetsp:Transcript_20425/g.60284  ORF Transcript_20425/g.60284 Transcript_20425/m.60284 type:complete len:237 (-) Transcript_20425:385-1095(-)